MKMKRIFINVDYQKLGQEKKDDVTPFMDAYLLDDRTLKAPRPAVIICPGGGYHHLCPREAEPVAMQLLSHGIQSFVLNYSLYPALFPMQLMEIATAVKHVRDHAEEWSIHPDEICVMGFSAGGNLAATLSCMWHQEFLTKALNVQPEEIKPNGEILCYAPIRFNDPAHRSRVVHHLYGLPEEYFDITDLRNRVTSLVPKTFMWCTWNDETVSVAHTLEYMSCLLANGVECESHIFREGKHGLSLATRETLTKEDTEEVANNPSVQMWMPLLLNWLEDIFRGEKS